MKPIRRLLHWWLNHDPEGLERAKQADEQAGVDLAQARRNGSRATRLMITNHLNERFIKEMREKHI